MPVALETGDRILDTGSGRRAVRRMCGVRDCSRAKPVLEFEFECRE